MASVNPVWYRLRIRDLADTIDEFIWTSTPAGASPYIEGAPSGDGQELDPLKGSVTVGAYRTRIVDVVTGANTRTVTSVLADAQARQQLLSRKAYIDYSTNTGPWVPMVGGYVNQVRLVDSITYEVTVGDTRRVELNKTVFQTATLKFNGSGCIVGGPIQNGWHSLLDFGPVKFLATPIALGGPSFVILDWLKGPAGPDYHTVDFTPLPGAVGILPEKTLLFCELACRSYFVHDIGWLQYGIQGQFPNVFAAIFDASHTFLGQFPMLAVPKAPLSQFGHHAWSPILNAFYGPGSSITNPFGQFYVNWPTGGPVPQPAFDSILYAYVFPSQIDADHPVHFTMHPVDFAIAMWTDNNIAYDAAAAASVRAALGPGLRIAGRVTQSGKLAQVLEQYLYGPFGVGARVNALGQMQLFMMRAKPSALPATTIGINDIRDSGTVPFDLDETTVCNVVTLKTQRYKIWSKHDGGTKPVDKATAIAVTTTVDDGNQPAFGTLEQVYSMEAAILFVNDYIIAGPGIPVQTSGDPDITKFTEALAASIFDLFGRGAIYTELKCFRQITEQVGDFAVLDLPHMPGAYAGQSPVSQRGTPRVAMVTKRTETAAGPELRLIDCGYAAFPTLVPTFALSLHPYEARTAMQATITNAGALAAITGLKVAIEVDFTNAPAGNGVRFASVNPATTPVYNLPKIDNGTVVSVRMRSEVPGNLPGAWSAWQTLTLTAFIPATTLAGHVQPYGDTHLITFTPGETDIPLAVTIVPAAGGGLAFYSALPAGSTQVMARGLQPNTAYIAGIYHQDVAPYNGHSAVATLSFTTATAQATAATPTHPQAIVGQIGEEGSRFIDGTYGIEVTAVEFPSTITLQSATETAPGSGTPGSYFDVQAEVATVDSASILNRMRLMTFAPNDGLKRFVRAYASRPGAVLSGNTAAIMLDPWAGAVGSLPGLIALP